MVGALVNGDPDSNAIVAADTDESLTYSALAAAIDNRMEEFADHGVDLAFLFAKNDISTAVDYLALRQLGSPVVLLDGAIADDRLIELIHAYKPRALIGNLAYLEGYRSHAGVPGAQLLESVPDPVQLDVPVSVLLPTSGSTGNPKFVQLTDENLNSNASDIVRSLGILGDDSGLQPLPLFYSYGLSILNSHLAAGATTVLTAASPLRPEFWDIVAKHAISSIPGVPYSYAMFMRAGLFDKDISTLRYMTQAGGKLDPESVLDVHAGLSSKGKQFFVMYGQTEASPRMSVLPSHDLPEHAHTAGFALDHGRFDIADQDSVGEGEVLYRGPNVMVGYAHCRADLGMASHSGPLETGDLGYLDPDGRLVITGRLKRIAKLFGNRISLQDIESHFAALGPVAAVEGDNRIRVFHEGVAVDPVPSVKMLERTLKVPPRTIELVGIEELPRNANGKIDYRGLAQ